MTKPIKRFHKNVPYSDYFDQINKIVDSKISNNEALSDSVAYLSKMAPNAVEWVCGLEYWNVPSTYRYYRQYQLIRDLFNLRCKLCNSQSPEAIDCWDKPRSYLESENLLVWSNEHQDFVCPKCNNTFQEFVLDQVVIPYHELVCIAGMRSGKSFLAAHIGGYIEHVLRVFSMKGRGSLQKLLKQEKSEWFEVTFTASTATQAKETIYAKYREMRNNSPWMNKHVSWIKSIETEQTGIKDKWEYKALDDSISDGYLQVRFNRVSSNSAGIAGKTRVFAAIDELSRLANTESKTSAVELYRVLNQSLKTVRGAKRKYKLFPYFGLMLNVTSPIAIDDLAMQIYNKAASGELVRTKSWKGATWEFNPELTFEDFKDEYEKDPVAAERDFGANPPAAETPLVDNVLRFWKSVDFSRRPIAKFSTVYLTDKTGKKYIGAKVSEVQYNFKDSHYLFCDAGETFDSFGIVCAHPDIFKGSEYTNDSFTQVHDISDVPEGFQHISNSGYVRLNGLGSQSEGPGLSGSLSYAEALRNPSYLGRLVTIYDFCIRIIPTREREIWFQSIIDIVKELKKKIKIAAVCFDSWQSTSAIQGIRDLGIQSFKVKLTSANFMEFLSHAYADQVSFLPPSDEDKFGLSEKGTIIIGKNEEDMTGEAVSLLELLRLERSADLRRVLAPDKGSVRGRRSDDLARCMVGANVIVKDSVVNNMLDSRRKRDRRKSLNAGGTEPKIFRNPFKK